MGKWLWRGLAGLAVLLVVVAGGGYLWLRSSLPHTDGRITVEGLRGPVDIVRDRHDIPHIYAGSQADALYALGFVHAQDRLWQMEMSRRIGAGRLSELLGKATVPTDRLLRMLGLYRVAQHNFAALDADARSLYEAYAGGVNAYLEHHHGALPPEFQILRTEPEPWVPADSVVWLKAMALDLGGNWSGELMRLRLAKTLTPKQIEDFYTPYGATAPRGVELAARLARPFRVGELDRLIRALPGEHGPGTGSNNWVVDGRHTASGKPLLANDPHLGLTTPSVWYFADLHWPGHDVVGATLPGIPAVVLGRNRHIAWGFTNTESDVEDLFIEKLDPKDPQRYLTPSGSAPFELRHEAIRVKGGNDVRMTLRSTRHGPVLDDALSSVRETMPKGVVLALQWTALMDDDLTPQALLRLGTAQDWRQFLAIARDTYAPQQNIVYADEAGNIGFIAPGRVPVRRPDNPIQGYMPSPGWDARYDWQGFIPFDALPRTYNPPGGVIVTANHKIVSDDYPYFISADWAPGYRAERIAELLKATDKHDIDSFAAIQGDVVSPFAKRILPLMLKAGPLEGRAREVRDMLQDWDGSMAADRPEPLIFNAWLREFARLISKDELGPLQEKAWARKGPFLLRVLRERPVWCDDRGTPAKESCPEMLARSLRSAVDWISKRQGNDAAKWRWGAEHVALSKHRPFHQVPALARLFDITGPAPGSTYTVDVGHFDIFSDARPFAAFHGPGLRAIYDLSAPERSRFIDNTGQSGNLLSPHYADMNAAWRAVKSVAIPTERGQVEAGAEGTLRLTPPS